MIRPTDVKVGHYGKPRFSAFEMKDLRQILRVSWTERKTKWVLDRARVKRKFLDTVKQQKLSFFGHISRKLSAYLNKDIMQGTIPS